jgi:hypothetical protein
MRRKNPCGDVNVALALAIFVVICRFARIVVRCRSTNLKTWKLGQRIANHQAGGSRIGFVWIFNPSRFGGSNITNDLQLFSSLRQFAGAALQQHAAHGSCVEWHQGPWCNISAARRRHEPQPLQEIWHLSTGDALCCQAACARRRSSAFTV